MFRVLVTLITATLLMAAGFTPPKASARSLTNTAQTQTTNTTDEDQQAAAADPSEDSSEDDSSSNSPVSEWLQTPAHVPSAPHLEVAFFRLDAHLPLESVFLKSEYRPPDSSLAIA